MPTDLCPRACPRRETSSRLAEGLAIALWAVAMIVISLASGITPPAG
jgi:hypothetical protein